MVYVILNIVAVLILSFLTKTVDKNIKAVSTQSGGFVVSLLLLTIEAAIFTVTLLFHSLLVDTMTNLLLKVMFSVDVLFFVTLSFGFMSIGANKKSAVLSFFRVLFYAIGIFIVFKEFKAIEISYKKGLFVRNNYLFSGEAKNYFPWSWYSLYNVVFRTILPMTGCFVMFVLREKTSTALQKYQAVLIAESLVIMWALEYFVSYVFKFNPEFSYLLFYPYIAFYVLVYQAFRKTSVPSGKGLFFNILRAITAYIIPAFALGFVFAFFKSKNKPGFDIYEMIIITASVVAIVFAWKIWDWIMYGSMAATNDYESNFEKGLASIDYTGEMDAVTERMFSVFRNNVECSSLGILADDGRGRLIPAYSSNNSTYSLPSSSTVFDVILNNGKNVVIYSEIDDQHEFDDIRAPLKAIFEEGKFDCMILLNEGHNILGILTLGKKISGDHYKDYDKNAFIKLYSYFFVFGYYVRNISNKEVLSTVNRELRMSSQIITSIQDNIDHIKSHKADVGYMMVPAHNIGGEFIDLVRLTDTRHLIVIGDLSGRGIAASMNMVILKSIIRTYLAETHDFKKLVVKVNTFIRESLKKGTIFAGLFALVDFETDTMYYINCGVPAMFLYTQVYNNVIEIQGSGHVLGFVKDITPYLSIKTTKLNRGDIILACTDGLVNSHSLRGEKYGHERVAQAVLDNATYPAQRMAQFTFEGLRKFMSREMEDDVSIFCLKYKTSAEFATPEELKASEAENAVQNEVITEETVSEETAAEVSVENSVETSLDAALDDFAGTAVVPESDSDTPVFETEEVFDSDITVESSDIEQEPVQEEFAVPEAEEFVVPDEPVKENMDFPSEMPVEDDFFVEDISKEKKPADGMEFEFDPKAFGLPDDFTL